MILGQSLFDSVLDKVGREKTGSSQPEYSGRVSVRGLSSIFFGSGSPGAVPHPGNQPGNQTDADIGAEAEAGRSQGCTYAAAKA
jgi:hypothetical protein